MVRGFIIIVFAVLCVTTALHLGCGAAATETGADGGGGEQKDTEGVNEDAGNADDAGTEKDTGGTTDAGAEDSGTPGDAGTPDDTGTPADSGADAGATDTGVHVDAGTDTGAPLDAGYDAGAPDAGAWDGGGGAAMGTLTVTNCDVPFVLDATKVSNMSYMTSHFGDLVQQYCITGTVGGVIIESYPEKMYYGSHSASPAALSLTQIGMTSSMVPQYSVKIDFEPDSNVTTGSAWTVGTQAVAAVIKFPTAQTTCLFGWGDSGALTFGTVSNVTATEGGTFTLSGTIAVVKPDATVCSSMPVSVPCCP